MQREIRDERYTTPAYWVQDDKEEFFWCDVQSVKNKTNEMGTLFPLANGQKILSTKTKYNFQTNDKIKVNGSVLRVVDTNETVDKKDNNSLRGVPTLIYKILVQ